MRANSFRGFSSRRAHEIKGHYKKSQRRYISPICGEFPTQPNLTKIGLWVGVADVINHTKFGNDRSRENKVTEGRILACSIGMACRLWHCSTTVQNVMHFHFQTELLTTPISVRYVSLRNYFMYTLTLSMWRKYFCTLYNNNIYRYSFYGKTRLFPMLILTMPVPLRKLLKVR